jgi:predicted nucleic acid-binding protein
MEEFLGQTPWSSSVLVLVEIYQALTYGYVVEPDSVTAAIQQWAGSAVAWRQLEMRGVLDVVVTRGRHGIDSADAHLLQLAQDDRGTLVTLDRRLLRVARAQGVAVRNPIGPALARAVAQWEDEHLPAKGLGRLLGRTEQWLREQDPRVADRFVQATEQLTRLPL